MYNLKGNIYVWEILKDARSNLIFLASFIYLSSKLYLYLQGWTEPVVRCFYRTVFWLPGNYVESYFFHSQRHRFTRHPWKQLHYSDVIVSPMASWVTGVSSVYLTVWSGVDQWKQQSSASLAPVRGIHRWPGNSSHKGPVTRIMFPFDDVIVLIFHMRPYIILCICNQNHIFIWTTHLVFYIWSFHH